MIISFKVMVKPQNLCLQRPFPKKKWQSENPERASVCSQTLAGLFIIDNNHNNVGNGNNHDNNNVNNNDDNNDNNNQLTTGGSEGPVTDNHLNVLNKTSLWFSSSIICDSKNYFSLIIVDCSKTPVKYSGSSSQSKFMKLHLSSSPPPKTEQNNMFWKIFEDKSLLHHYQILGYPL